MPFLPAVFLVLLLYYPVLGTYFSQDDFFHFKVSQTDGSLRGFLRLFGAYSFEQRKIAFYRPVFREVLYHTFYSWFGLNPLPFRILSFGVHFTNIYLIFSFLQRLFNEKKVAYFAAFLYGVSAANVATLYYLAGGIQALGATMFLLLSLIFFWDYTTAGKVKKKALAFITFLLALGSHEQAVVIPFLLAGILFVRLPARVFVRRAIFELWPFFLIVGLYSFVDLKVIGFSAAEQQYHFSFSLKQLLNTFSWYVVWSVGLPEMVIDFVLPGLKLKPSLMRYWPYFYKPIFLGFVLVLGIIVLSVLYLVWKHKEIFREKAFWLLVFWFPLAMAPVLFLPAHKSTYYLTCALPAFWGAVGFLLINASDKFLHIRLKSVLGGAFVGAVAVLMTFSALAGRDLYWAASRGKLAKALIYEVYSRYPTLEKGSAVYFKNDPNYPFIAQDWGSTSKQVMFVLNNQEAIQLFYHDSTLKVFYEDLGGVPPSFNGRVYPLVAHLR